MDENEFRAGLAADGYQAPTVVSYEAGRLTETHTHAFGARALVTAGEITVGYEGREVTCRAGDSFALDAGIPHFERTGPQGVTFIAGRKPV